ncbi:sigma-70 family RNA polymerase sigma factor [Aestuariispira insulae]|uniref:RNA polymerase RpoE-like sigma-24 subunit n=1 Tax=Aestuariispira insulae TaxID=1461337 RepID=A0A3D9HDW2_9PROT|nr:sigma-70 family RNA polymerase sigma factor [Aestuariispira insulae]RED47657.1 RNA polymerase RpoE-like sigma-24 subunit [Aestuariispira insulae]
MTEPRPVAEHPEQVFERLRAKLFAVAYQMLGSVGDAEDMVQDCYLRWQALDPSEIRDPEAFLVRVVSRLSLDHLKSARVRRENYVGEWLPEPLITDLQPDPEPMEKDVSFALLYAMERLSPLERTAFILHDVFDHSFEEVSKILQRTPSTCRQLAVRARKHLRDNRPRFDVPEEEGQRITQAFFEAARKGDADRLGALLAPDAILISDGGGKTGAAINPIYGSEKVIRLLTNLARKRGYQIPGQYRFLKINQMPGILNLEEDGLVQTTALEIQDGKIQTVYVTRNPDKTRHLSLATH